MKVTIGWAETKDDFICSNLEGEWILTTENELKQQGGASEYIDESRIKERFLVFGRAIYHTTDFLRSFCNARHPEIEFDTEFETDNPGVIRKIPGKVRL